jgi:DNA-binding NarL/FixJ family response regulator
MYGSVEMTQATKTIRVLIADDSPTALRSVCDFLEFAGGFEIVGTASDGLNAVQLASSRKPDLVLLDLSMPRVNGLEAAQQIRLSSPDLRVIIFSELNGLSLADECRRHGADSFVHKSHLPDRLLPEIERLFSSGDYGHPRPSDN